jgi:O-antigen/teichoic acid export membrane protein
MTRLTKNVIYNTAGQGLVLILSFIAVRFIFRRLGDDVFGIIFFNLVLTAVLTSALELGVLSTIVREVSGHFESEPAYIHDLIRTASVLYWGSGLLLVAVIWLTAPLLVTHWINLKALDPDTAATTLRILSASALVTLPRGLYTSLFRGRQMMALNNAIDVATAAVQQAGIVLLLLAGGRVYFVAAWISASALLGLIAYIVVAGRLFGWRALTPSFSMEVVRRNVSFTSRTMLTSVLSLLHLQAAQVIVSKLLPVAVFGLYGFASSTVNRATIVTGAVGQAALPSLSHLSRLGDRGALLTQYRKLQDALCYGTVPLFAGVIFAALPVYGYIFNPPSAWLLMIPTAWLCLGWYMSATVVISHMFSLAVGRPDIAMRTTLLALFVVLPVTAALIYWFGLPGAGFSWVFYHAFVYAYMVRRICKECLYIAPSAWYGHVAKAMAAAAATYGLAWVAVAIPSRYSLPGLVIAYVIASLGFMAAAYFLIGPDLKTTLRGLPVMKRALAYPLLGRGSG